MILLLIVGIVISKKIDSHDKYVKVFFWWLLLLTGITIQLFWSLYLFVNSVRNKQGPGGEQGEIGPPGPQGPPGVCRCPNHNK